MDSRGSGFLKKLCSEFRSAAGPARLAVAADVQMREAGGLLGWKMPFRWPQFAHEIGPARRGELEAGLAGRGLVEGGLEEEGAVLTRLAPASTGKPVAPDEGFVSATPPRDLGP
jgi:hypothetical protein